MTSQRKRWTLCAVVLLIAGASPATAAAAPPHAFPRTYHVWGGWVDKKRLAKYDMLVGYSNYDVSFLRSRNRRGIFLLTPSLRSRSGDEGLVVVQYGAVNRWTGGWDRLRGGINLGYIRPFNARWDYLWNANGTLARRNITSGVHGWNLADPTRHGTPALVAKVFAFAAKQGGLHWRGWNGVHSDSWNFAIGGPSRYGPKIDTNRDGKVDDQEALQRNWCNGFARVGRLLRYYMPRKIVGGNGTWFKPHKCRKAADPGAWLKTSNYTMIENFQQFYNSPGEFLRIARRWLGFPDPRGRRRHLAVLQDAFACDGSEIRVPAGADPNSRRYMLNRCVARSMRWGLTLALMTGAYYEIKSNSFASRWWYDEFDGGRGIRRRGYLGQPKGPPRIVAPRIFRRTFANGIVINNSSALSRTVRLGRTYRRIRGTQNPRLNNGRRIRSVRVPAHDGVILVVPWLR
jgi:hypothetical protein